MRIDAQDWAVREIHVKLRKGSNVNWIRDLVLDSEYQLVGGRGSYKGRDSLWFFKQDRMYADFSVTMRDSSKLMSFLGRRQCDYLDPRFDTPMPDSVSKLSGATKRQACSVMTTRTAAPSFFSRLTISHALYAAIPPVTPSTTHFPFSISLAPFPANSNS